MRQWTSIYSRRLLVAGTIAVAAFGLALPQGFAADQSTMPKTGQSTQSTGQQMQSTSPAQPSLSRDQLIGKELRSANGENFGEIEDVVEEQGTVKAVVVEVGGFLGLGAKRVAVPAEQISPQGDHVLAKGLTQTEIEKMPEHKMPEKGNMLTK